MYYLKKQLYMLYTQMTEILLIQSLKKLKHMETFYLAPTFLPHFELMQWTSH